MATPNNAVAKYPELLTNDKLEIAYVGMLHNNPKGIAIYYLDFKDCCFSVPGLLDIYKLVLFREGQAYAPATAKAGFSFPKVTEETPKMIDICKKYASQIKDVDIEGIYIKIKKLFLLRSGYLLAPTPTIQERILAIKNYKRYNEMTIDEIDARVKSMSYISSFNDIKINAGATKFLLEGDNNLTNGIKLPFPILSKTFKGLRKGETTAFSMPSNSGKSRFIVNLICHLCFVEGKKVLLISNEMTEDKMRLCLITTIVNNPEIQKLHGQKLHKREAELLGLKFRADEGKNIEVDKDGFIVRLENESQQDYLKRLSENSTEFVKTVAATDWLSEQIDDCIYFVHTSEHSNQDLTNIILDYYYKEGIEYYFYDTLKTDIENIGNLEELKKTATVLSNLAQKFNMFIGSTLQLAESPTPPLNMNINDIAGSRTVKEVLDTLCLIKEINKSTYDQYEISDEEDAEIYQPLEIPKLSNTKYYACVVDKNRAGAKPKVLFRLNLDFNRWEEVGYVRYKQVKNENN